LDININGGKRGTGGPPGNVGITQGPSVATGIERAELKLQREDKLSKAMAGRMFVSLKDNAF
jgi:hypothetical protein